MSRWKHVALPDCCVSMIGFLFTPVARRQSPVCPGFHWRSVWLWLRDPATRQQAMSLFLSDDALPSFKLAQAYASVKPATRSPPVSLLRDLCVATRLSESTIMDIWEALHNASKQRAHQRLQRAATAQAAGAPAGTTQQQQSTAPMPMARTPASTPGAPVGIPQPAFAVGGTVQAPSAPVGTPQPLVASNFMATSQVPSTQWLHVQPFTAYLPGGTLVWVHGTPLAPFSTRP